MALFCGSAQGLMSTSCAGSPGNFHSGSWGAPSGERWADSAPPMRPGQGYGGPPPAPYGGMDGRMDVQGPPYMPSQGAG